MHLKKKYLKKIINIYPNDKKLKFCLNIFIQKRLYEEFIGCIINNEKFNAKKIINNIQNKFYKMIFLILLKIPFSKFFTKFFIFILKSILFKMIKEIQVHNYEYSDEIYSREFILNKQDIEFKMRKEIAQMSFR